MSNDDELRSVRVELEGGQSSTTDAPLIEGASSTRRGPLVLGLVAVALLVVAFLSLRPASDEAADGTERQAPAEEVAPPEDTESESEAGTDEPNSSEAELPVSSADALVPQRVEADSDLWQIVPVDTGFFGLSFDDSSQFLRSLDGIDWFPVEASFTPLDGADSNSMFWSGLKVTPNGLQMIGASRVSFEAEARTFVSETGAEWTELDLGGPADEDQIFTSVINDDAVFGFVYGGQDRISTYIREHFDFDVPESGICDVFQEFVDAKVFEVVGCFGQRVGGLDESNVTNPEIADQVLDCLADGMNWFYGQSSTLVRQDRTDGGERTVLRELSGSDRHVVLASGDIAMLELETVDREQLSACEGLIDWPEPVEPSVVVLSSESEQLVSWPTPDGVELEISGSGFTSAFLVGDTEVGGSSELLVYLDGDLWAIAPESGEWRGPILRDLERADGSPTSFALSISGNRVYRVDDGALHIFEFVERPDGSRDTVETLMPFAEASFPRQFNDAWMPYADDDVIFIQSNTGLRVLDIPEIRR